MSEFKDTLVRQVETSASPEQRQASWQNSFTDPRNHNPRNFTYLVHGLNSPIGRAIQAIALHDIGTDPNKKPDVDLEREPLRIAEKPIISTSVIDRRHSATWGNAGLILRTPPENIVSIYREDAGTPWYDPEKSLEATGGELACTVDELLEQTRPSSYNEVVIQGSTEAGKTEVVGFFIKKFLDNSLVEEELAKRMFVWAHHNNLPVVEILDSSPRQSKGQMNAAKLGFTTPRYGANLDIDLDLEIPK